MILRPLSNLALRPRRFGCPTPRLHAEQIPQHRCLANTFQHILTPLPVYLHLLLYVCAYSIVANLPLTQAFSAGILGQIVESLYSVKQVVPSRHAEAARIEKQLDKFYLDLPPFLKFDGSSHLPPPPPHILTFNMQYWNTVLLLHRPL